MMKARIPNIPDEDHVMRNVSWGRLRRDENDNVLGCLPQAFESRPDEEYLSVNWIEYEGGDWETRIRISVWAIRRNRNVGPKSAFAIGEAGNIKATCLTGGTKVRITHEPLEDNPGHAGIRRLPKDDLFLLSLLADDAFSDLIANADIPTEDDRTP
jgi:hypothetical protein